MFGVYFQLGLEHITDLQGYDHILFLAALCAIYNLHHWKRLLILVTAFTLGHSLTLALAAFRILKLPSDLIEFLIPVTILLTALYNFFLKPQRVKSSKLTWHYALALLFGLIHGLGFSNFFRQLLGQEADIALPLLSFNLGVEAGQIAIVLIILLLNHIFLQLPATRQRYWTWTISAIAAILSIRMILSSGFLQGL